MLKLDFSDMYGYLHYYETNQGSIDAQQPAREDRTLLNLQLLLFEAKALFLHPSWLRWHELPQPVHLTHLTGAYTKRQNIATKTRSLFGLFLLIFWLFNLALLILRLCYFCSLQKQSSLHTFNT